MMAAAAEKKRKIIMIEIKEGKDIHLLFLQILGKSSCRK
jgi:hypothetical protein